MQDEYKYILFSYRMRRFKDWNIFESKDYSIDPYDIIKPFKFPEEYFRALIFRKGGKKKKTRKKNLK